MIQSLPKESHQKPVDSLHVADYIEKSLVSLYEDDSMYDRFFLDVSPEGSHLLTGTYSKSAVIMDI
jgi:hypothetical protein